MPHLRRSPHSIYGAVEGALASGFVTAELHHPAGHDRWKRTGNCETSVFSKADGKLGADGWELVAVVSPAHFVLHYFFKREVRA